MNPQFLIDDKVMRVQTLVDQMETLSPTTQAYIGGLIDMAVMLEAKNPDVDMIS